MKILVVDGNTAETNAANMAAGGKANSVQYAAVLQRLVPDLETVCVHPTEDGPECLPAGMVFTDFHGITWTGSALNIYESSDAITSQLKLAEKAWDSEVPVFGSCWGLQVFTTMLGGRVHKNPEGREIGLARSIYLTAEGRAHPMYAGKDSAFDALASHTDEVIEPPPGAVLLASNAVSKWQALAVEDAGRSFWGVQYHPELDLGVLSVILRRYGQRLIDAGLFAHLDDLNAASSEWQTLHADVERKDIAFKYGISVHVLDRARHELELANWLGQKASVA